MLLVIPGSLWLRNLLWYKIVIAGAKSLLVNFCFTLVFAQGFLEFISLVHLINIMVKSLASGYHWLAVQPWASRKCWFPPLQSGDNAWRRNWAGCLTPGQHSVQSCRFLSKPGLCQTLGLPVLCNQRPPRGSGWCCFGVLGVNYRQVPGAWRCGAWDVQESHCCWTEFGQDGSHLECRLLSVSVYTESHLTSCFESSSQETDGEVFCSVVTELPLEAFDVQDPIGWKWCAVGHACV